MKPLLAFLIPLLAIPGLAQYNEFGNADGSLIYSDSAIVQLKHIVDSLQLKFKVCNINRTYRSLPVAKAHYILLEKTAANRARKDLNAHISFNGFIKKYPKAIIHKNLMILQSGNEFYSPLLGKSDKYGHTITVSDSLSKHTDATKGHWIYYYSSAENYLHPFLEAFFFTEDFSDQQLPDRYARMIQYADCLIDTTTDVFYPNAIRTDDYPNTPDTSAGNVFMRYFYKATRKPELNTANMEESLRNYEIWDSLKYERADSLWKNDTQFVQLFSNAMQKLDKPNITTSDFETLTGKFYSRKAELELKRKKIVIGSCGRDDAPRKHALEIARLAAETANWEIFLRAHLNIMNDLFLRSSDGSYAWKARKTYLRELEVLDINLPDLLMGISLNFQNPAHHHYYGDVSRIGRAIAETSNNNETELFLQQAIADSTLDDYNRLNFYFMLTHYIYNLTDKIRQKKAIPLLKTTAATLPTYLRYKLNN